MSFLRNLVESNIAEEKARFMCRVYLWMFLGLGVTALTAYTTFNSKYLSFLILGNVFGWFGTAFLQMGLLIKFSADIDKFSSFMAKFLFFLYCVASGLTFSAIFAIYQLDSIISVFGLTSGMFAGLSAYGFFTKRNLSSWGNLLFGCLCGLILLSVRNFFFYRDTLDLIISAVGVFIFAGLTAYDTQKIKALNVIGNEGTEEDSKEAIYGAFILYLDFLNLFLKLLRLTGRRRS